MGAAGGCAGMGAPVGILPLPEGGRPRHKGHAAGQGKPGGKHCGALVHARCGCGRGRGRSSLGYGAPGGVCGRQR